MNTKTSVIKVRVNKVTANVVAIIFTGLLCAGFIVLAHALPHYSASREGWQVVAVLVLIAANIVTHEALHGIGMVWFGNAPIRALHFGIMRPEFIPYCHCMVPLSVRVFIRMALLPLWVMGGAALAFLFVFPSDWLGLVTGVIVAACVGDVWVCLATATIPSGLARTGQPHGNRLRCFPGGH